MTKNAQQALKYLLQTSSNNVRFCLICNYISKIDESLQNEFICIRFNQLPKNDIYQFMKTIAVKEDILISEDAINSIQTMYHSDIRSMINFLQLNQNLQMKEWEKNVINGSLLETIYKKIKSECSVSEFIRYIHTISIQYNVDKKHIIQSFFNHLIRTHSSDVTESLLDVIANMTHTVDINLDDLLTYFYVSLRDKI